MNPYEPPQSSLEPVKRPTVPVQYEKYDTREIVRVMLGIVLVLSETILGLLLGHRLAVALGLYADANVAGLDEMLPYLIVGFLVVGGMLWWLRTLGEPNN